MNASVSPHYLRVAAFMEKAKQEIPTVPTIPDVDTRRLRCRLLFEEALEFAKGCGFTVWIGNPSDQLSRPLFDHLLVFVEDGTPDFTEMVDALADVSVINTGSMIAVGVFDEILLREVDQNNLDKFGPGHSIREDGKLVKPAGHLPPNIGRVINACNEIHAEGGWALENLREEFTVGSVVKILHGPYQDCVGKILNWAPDGKPTIKLHGGGSCFTSARNLELLYREA